jgi:hypothetical protein
MTASLSPKSTGPATVRYFEGTTFVGSREQYCCGYSPAGSTEILSAFWPHIAYFCPMCGEIWGREVLDPEFAYSPIPKNLWALETRRCAFHGDGLFLSGLRTDSLLETCSPELLRREALLLCSG